MFFSSNNQKNVKSGVTALSSTSNAFGNAVANGKFDASNGIDENLKLQILAEEEAAMNQFKVGYVKYVIHFSFRMPTSHNSKLFDIDSLDNSQWRGIW